MHTASRVSFELTRLACRPVRPSDGPAPCWWVNSIEYLRLRLICDLSRELCCAARVINRASIHCLGRRLKGPTRVEAMNSAALQHLPECENESPESVSADLAGPPAHTCRQAEVIMTHLPICVDGGEFERAAQVVRPAAAAAFRPAHALIWGVTRP